MRGSLYTCVNCAAFAVQLGHIFQIVKVFQIRSLALSNHYKRTRSHYKCVVVVVTPSSLSRLLVILYQDFLDRFGVQGWFAIAFPFYLLIFVRSLFLVFSSTKCVPTLKPTGLFCTEKYNVAPQYIIKLIKPSYMFQLYSHHHAYLQSLGELYVYMLNTYAMWDPSSEAQDLHVELKNMNHSVGR
jgi:hypothetical protein